MRDKIIEIGRDSAWYLFAAVAAALLGFIAVPIFTRLFDPSEYGIYSLVSTSIILGTPLVSMWLVNAIVRFYPEYAKRDELDVFYTTALHKIPYFLFFFLAVLLPVALFFLPLGQYRAVICLGIAVFALFSVFRVLLGILRARQMSWQYASLLVFVQFGRYIGGAILVSWFGAGVEGPFWGWLGALILIIPVEFILLSLKNRLKTSKFSPDLQKEFVKYGFPLIFVTLLSEILTAADRYMVQGFKGAEQVGLYSVVYTLVSSIEAMLASIMMLGSSPVIMKVYEHEGQDATVDLISKVTRYFLLLLIPSMVGICVLRHRLLSVITAASYIEAADVVIPLAVGVFMGNLMWVPFLAFQVKKKTNVSLIPVGAAAALNIAINLFLIPKFGYAGAAWATLISYLVGFVLVVIISLGYLPLRFPYLDSIKIAAASAVMGACLFGLEIGMIGGWLGLALLIVAGAVIYGLALLAVGEIKKSELQFVSSLPGALLKRLLRRGGDRDD